MGRSNALLKNIYEKLVSRIKIQKIYGAVLGSPGPYLVSNLFSNAKFDYYDLFLNNWNINSDWNLVDKYNLILSNRCPYFAKNPKQFIDKCHESLMPGGAILLDWGYGDHWRFTNYKIGWVKNGEQEYCYGDTNYLWSGIWDDSFMENQQFKFFEEWTKKFGYDDVKKAVFDEIPSVLPLSYIKQKFNIYVDLAALWKESPQLYIFITGFVI